MDLFGNNEIRALSWKEPFATLMLHGKIETRKWATTYRGLVLICASKKSYTEMELIEMSGQVGAQKILVMFNEKGIKEQNGCAIAVGELVDCQPMKWRDRMKCFVEYNPDLYCHIYKNVRAIKPIPIKGQQGWKKLNQEFINNVQFI